MASIAATVQQLIEEKPFLENALASDIINFRKLAEVLLPEIIDRSRGNTITVDAVMMALRRLGKKLRTAEGEVLKGLEMNLNFRSFKTIDRLFEVTVKRSAQPKIRKIYNIVDPEKGDYLAITQGSIEITIISNAFLREEILGLFENNDIIAVQNDLDALSLQIDENSFDTPGILYLFTKQLYFDDINIIEAVSTFTELVIIVRSMDTYRARKSLHKLLDIYQ